MKRIKKLSIFMLNFILLTFFVCSFGGCGWWTSFSASLGMTFDNVYNAKLYDDADEWASKEFLEENKVSGAYYVRPDYVEGSGQDRLYRDLSAPETRTFVITNEYDYKEIFTESEVKVDFEKQMVVFYLCSINHRRDGYLYDVVLEGKTLTVSYVYEYTNRNDASRPGVEGFMLVIDKLDVDEIVFTEVG